MIKRYLLQGILFLSMFFAVERFCHKQTHGFRLHKIYSEMTPHPSNSPNLDTIRPILSQSFSFLESGGEAYVFLSEDKRYILKLFKQHHIRPTLWTSLLPRKIATHFHKKREEKRNTFLLSCQMAHERFEKRSALLFLHLHTTDDLQINLPLFDPIGIRHLINLDTVQFALQKRASLAYPTLSTLISIGATDRAESCLSSWIALIIERCNAGLRDHDARKRNFGFIGEEAVEIDLGSFTLDESLLEQKSKTRAVLAETQKLSSWLNKYHPEFAPYFHGEVSRQLKEDLNTES